MRIDIIEAADLVSAYVYDDDFIFHTKPFQTYGALLGHVAEVIASRKSALEKLGPRGEVP